MPISGLPFDSTGGGDATQPRQNNRESVLHGDSEDAVHLLGGTFGDKQNWIDTYRQKPPVLQRPWDGNKFVAPQGTPLPNTTDTTIDRFDVNNIGFISLNTDLSWLTSGTTLYPELSTYFTATDQAYSPIEPGKLIMLPEGLVQWGTGGEPAAPPTDAPNQPFLGGILTYVPTRPWGGMLPGNSSNQGTSGVTGGGITSPGDGGRRPSTATPDRVSQTAANELNAWWISDPNSTEPRISTNAEAGEETSEKPGIIGLDTALPIVNGVDAAYLEWGFTNTAAPTKDIPIITPIISPIDDVGVSVVGAAVNIAATTMPSGERPAIVPSYGSSVSADTETSEGAVAIDPAIAEADAQLAKLLESTGPLSISVNSSLSSTTLALDLDTSGERLGSIGQAFAQPVSEATWNLARDIALSGEKALGNAITTGSGLALPVDIAGQILDTTFEASQSMESRPTALNTIINNVSSSAYEPTKDVSDFTQASSNYAGAWNTAQGILSDGDKASPITSYIITDGMPTNPSNDTPKPNPKAVPKASLTLEPITDVPLFQVDEMKLNNPLLSGIIKFDDTSTIALAELTGASTLTTVSAIGPESTGKVDLTVKSVATDAVVTLPPTAPTAQPSTAVNVDLMKALGIINSNPLNALAGFGVEMNTPLLSSAAEGRGIGSNTQAPANTNGVGNGTPVASSTGPNAVATDSPKATDLTNQPDLPLLSAIATLANPNPLIMAGNVGVNRLTPFQLASPAVLGATPNLLGGTLLALLPQNGSAAANGSISVNGAPMANGSVTVNGTAGVSGSSGTGPTSSSTTPTPNPTLPKPPPVA